jgi:hypothetical protein
MIHGSVCVSADGGGSTSLLYMNVCHWTKLPLCTQTQTRYGYFLAYIQSWWYCRPSLLRVGVPWSIPSAHPLSLYLPPPLELRRPLHPLSSKVIEVYSYLYSNQSHLSPSLCIQQYNSKPKDDMYCTPIRFSSNPSQWFSYWSFFGFSFLPGSQHGTVAGENVRELHRQKS